MGEVAFKFISQIYSNLVEYIVQIVFIFILL